MFGVAQARGREAVDWAEYEGESSWLAVPELPLDDVVVLHQVRDPLEVIRSIVGIGLLVDPPELRPGHARFAAVIRQHAPDVFAPESRSQRAAHLWRIWNAEAGKHAAITYRLEDLDERLLVRLARRLDIDVDERDASRALSRVPRSVNRRRRDESVTWADVAPVVEDLAEEYAYRIDDEIMWRSQG